MRIGIIICSRKKSNRIYEKPFQELAGKKIINHLIDRLQGTNLPIVVAVPSSDINDYDAVVDRKKAKLTCGDHFSPLHRMAEVAYINKFDAVIRVTHDKIFLEPKVITDAVFAFIENKVDYLYSSHLPDGAGFEIISGKLLATAAQLFAGQQIEHISYAVRSINDGTTLNYIPDPKYREPTARFLIDFPEDLQFLDVLLAGNADMTLLEAMDSAAKQPWLVKINAQPEVTVYTCAHNAESTINRTIFSALTQVTPFNFEYLVIDDKSTDFTLRNILHSGLPNLMKVIQNPINLGLAASSNVALDAARGKYIIRLDADDFFMRPDAIAILHDYMTSHKLEACYPTYLDEKTGQLVSGDVNHHAGCAMFDIKALRYLRFSEELRHYEGLDLYLRASKCLNNIGYANDPIFYYSYSENSMSNTKQDERLAIKNRLLKLVPKS
jgi:spore coat polysaccharide biosynthesis protein SpsF (cytidylyltransferase family)